MNFNNTEINIDIQNLNYVNTEINIDIDFNFFPTLQYILQIYMN